MTNPLYRCGNCTTITKILTPSCVACDAPNSLVKAPKGTKMPRRRRFGGPSPSPFPSPLSSDGGFGLDDEGGDDEIAGLSNARRDPKTSKPVGKVKVLSPERVSTGLPGFNRVLGKNRTSPKEGPFGAARGSSVVVAGEPGIGKSTLLVQTIRKFASKGLVLYATGEQSEGDIRLYAESFGPLSKTQKKNFRILESNSTDDLIAEVEAHEPMVLIVDSRQTFTSENANGDGGSKPQDEYMNEHLIRGACKPRGVITFIVSQVTKEGIAAGSNSGAHLADTLLFFAREDPDNEENPYRILSAPKKNRLGATGVKARFKMTERGLVGYKIPKTKKAPKRSKRRKRKDW